MNVLLTITNIIIFSSALCLLVESVFWESSGDSREHCASSWDGWHDYNNCGESEPRERRQWNKNSEYSNCILTMGLNVSKYPKLWGQINVIGLILVYFFYQGLFAEANWSSLGIWYATIIKGIFI